MEPKMKLGLMELGVVLIGTGQTLRGDVEFTYNDLTRTTSFFF